MGVARTGVDTRILSPTPSRDPRPDFQMPRTNLGHQLIEYLALTLAVPDQSVAAYERPAEAPPVFLDTD